MDITHCPVSASPYRSAGTGRLFSCRACGSRLVINSTRHINGHGACRAVECCDCDRIEIFNDKNEPVELPTYNADECRVDGCPHKPQRTSTLCKQHRHAYENRRKGQPMRSFVKEQAGLLKQSPHCENS